MCPTIAQLDRTVGARFCQAAEPSIPVHLQSAAEPGQMLSRVLAFAILGIYINRHRMGRALPRAIIYGITPQAGLLGLASARLEHWQRRLIGKYLVRRHHRAEHQFIQWRQPPTRATDPRAQCRTVQVDALAFEYLYLPIKCCTQDYGAE